MAFDKKTWANNQAGGTPLDASGLNDLEDRIESGIAEFLNTASMSGAWLSGQGRFTDKKTGLMIQWRQAEVTLVSGVGSIAVAMPMAFPNQVIGAIISPNALNNVDSSELDKITASIFFYNKQTGTARIRHSSTSATYRVTFTVLALGY